MSSLVTEVGGGGQAGCAPKKPAGGSSGCSLEAIVSQFNKKRMV